VTRLRSTVLIAFTALATASLTATAGAQTFDLSWYTIDGGGDLWTSGGDFELSGTIGQPDAGPVLTGGGFALTGGFWAAPPAPPVVPGDVNCDGAIDFNDINPFVLALSDPGAYQAAYPDCDILSADCNGDGVVDFNDINAFVALLSGG